MTMRVLLLAASMLVTAGASVLNSASAPDATIVVRTYDYTIGAAADLADARVEAARIFRSAGIAIQWVACRVPTNPDGEACTEPLAAGRDLMLRLIDRTPADGSTAARAVALGESILDRGQRGGVLMTIDLFPIRRIAAGSGTPLATLTGRAIAHEIGHLLLGTPDHSALGLMRPFWSRDELRGLRPAHWGFSSKEAARMRKSMARRRAGAITGD